MLSPSTLPAGPDPNCPTIESARQYWVLVKTEGFVQDMIRDHIKTFATVTASSMEQFQTMAMGLAAPCLPH